MRYCDACGEPIPPDAKFEHFFCGYGFAVKYCSKACCPGELDGIKCDACAEPYILDEAEEEK